MLRADHYFICEKRLAKRWKMSHRTLQHWRSIQEGPLYAKLGGSICYRMDVVKAFEARYGIPPRLKRIKQIDISDSESV